MGKDPGTNTGYKRTEFNREGLRCPSCGSRVWLPGELEAREAAIAQRNAEVEAASKPKPFGRRRSRESWNWIRQEVVRRRRLGETHRAIAEALGIKPHTSANVWRRYQQAQTQKRMLTKMERRIVEAVDTKKRTSDDDA